jgi:hypothetical protein
VPPTATTSLTKAQALSSMTAVSGKVIDPP